MTAQQEAKTVIWVLGGLSGALLLVVSFFLVQFNDNINKNFDELNARVDIIQVIQRDMQDVQTEMKTDVRYIKLDTVRMQEDIEDLKKKLKIR